jgi:hypothetical protein
LIEADDLERSWLFQGLPITLFLNFVTIITNFPETFCLSNESVKAVRFAEIKTERS